MKAQFYAHTANQCYLTHDDEWGGRIERFFWSTRNGDVFEGHASDAPQVFERLSRTGPALYHNRERGPLIDLIRREWRKVRAAEKRAAR